MHPILSVRYLASLLGISVTRLREIAGNVESHYRVWPLVYANGQKVRTLWIPSDELKELQRRIHRNILARLPLGNEVQGGVRGRSCGSVSGGAKEPGKTSIGTLGLLAIEGQLPCREDTKEA